MNIYDVSQRSGFSIATVSRVINGSSSVSEATKNKVLSVMREMGYTPNVFARGLGLNTMNTIGIMCSDSSDPFLANAVYYLEQNLRKNGYDSFLCCTGYELKNRQKYLNLLLGKRVDAVILVGSSLIESNEKDNDYIINAASSVPVMLINGVLPGENIYSCVCDDRGAVFTLTDHLIKSGLHHILYLYSSRSGSGMSKLSGFKDALSANSVPGDPGLICFVPCDIAKTRDFLLELYKTKSFDAIICSEDQLAVGAVKFAKKLGFKVPEDIQITGYNNSILSSCTDPEITSIDNHVEALSATAVSNLMHVLEKTKVPNKTILSNEIIWRETTGRK